MAFTSKRGRPRKAADAIDLGTPELRFKHAHGITSEPIDRCLDKQLITPTQHWCGLHLRWLYTVRYGAPVVTTRYDTIGDGAFRIADDPAWRHQREAEYHAATALLRTGKHYEPVMQLCVFNESPVFLAPALLDRAWDEPALATRLSLARQRLCEGLDILAVHWKRRKSPCDK